LKVGDGHVFALTGGIASGKSRVAQIYQAQGIPVVDADKVAREVVAPGSEGLFAVAQSFGANILTSRGALNRSALGAQVFENPQARARLEAILHPLIQRRAQACFRQHASEGQALICYDIPLLFETKQESQFRPVVVVFCERSQQLARLMGRDGLSEQAAEARINAQLPLVEKRTRADVVIDNRGGLDELEARVLVALEEVRRAL
jgi:dephospho-CoA kinase